MDIIHQNNTNKNSPMRREMHSSNNAERAHNPSPVPFKRKSPKQALDGWRFLTALATVLARRYGGAELAYADKLRPLFLAFTTTIAQTDKRPTCLLLQWGRADPPELAFNKSGIPGIRGHP